MILCWSAGQEGNFTGGMGHFVRGKGAGDGGVLLWRKFPVGVSIGSRIPIQQFMGGSAAARKPASAQKREARHHSCEGFV